MTFDDAVLTAARAVKASPQDMLVSTFQILVPSLVVRVGSVGEEYDVMSLYDWRRCKTYRTVVLAFEQMFRG